MTSIMVYGFTKDDAGYKPEEKYTLYPHDISIVAMRYLADKFMSENENVVEVIAVDNRVGLKQEWLKAISSNLTDERYEFYDTVKKAGYTLAER